MEGQTVNTFIGYALLGAIPVVTSLIGWGLTELALYVRSKTKSNYVKEALGRLIKSTDDMIKSSGKDVVEKIKLALEDGKITDAELKEIHCAAVKGLDKYSGKLVKKYTSPRELVSILKDAIRNR